MVLNESKAEKILGVVFTVWAFSFWPSSSRHRSPTSKCLPQPPVLPQYHRGIDDRAGHRAVCQRLAQEAPKQEDERPIPRQEGDPPQSFLTLGIVILYVIILHFIPYIPSTMVFFWPVLITLYGQRNKLKIILPSVLLPIIISVGFTLRASAAHALKEEECGGRIKYAL